MKRNIIITAVIILLITFISAINKPREVYCEQIGGLSNVKNTILRKSKEGWRLTHITTYSSPSLDENSLSLIVMER